MAQNDTNRSFRIGATWCGLAGLAYYLFLQVFTGAATLVLRFQMPGASLTQPGDAAPVSVEFLSMLVSVFSLGGTALLLAKASPLSSRQMLLGRARWQPFWLLVPGFLLLSQGANLLAGLLRGVTGTSITYQLPRSGAALLFSLLTLCVVPAVGEELLFRGAVQGLLRPYGARAALMAQAVIFALLHREISQCCVAFICALAFGWVAQAAGSIRPGMLLHVLNNLISVTEMYLLQYYGDLAAASLEAFLLLAVPIWALGAIAWGWQQGALKPLRLPKNGPSAAALFTTPGYLLAVLFLAALCVMRNFFA